MHNVISKHFRTIKCAKIWCARSEIKSYCCARQKYHGVKTWMSTLRIWLCDALKLNHARILLLVPLSCKREFCNSTAWENEKCLRYCTGAREKRRRRKPCCSFRRSRSEAERKTYKFCRQTEHLRFCSSVEIKEIWKHCVGLNTFWTFYWHRCQPIYVSFITI